MNLALSITLLFCLGLDPGLVFKSSFQTSVSGIRDSVARTHLILSASSRPLHSSTPLDNVNAYSVHHLSCCMCSSVALSFTVKTRFPRICTSVQSTTYIHSSHEKRYRTSITATKVARLTWVLIHSPEHPSCSRYSAACRDLVGFGVNKVSGVPTTPIAKRGRESPVLLCRKLPVAPDTATDFTESTRSSRLNHVSYGLYSGHKSQSPLQPTTKQADRQQAGQAFSISPENSISNIGISSHYYNHQRSRLAQSTCARTQQLPRRSNNYHDTNPALRILDDVSASSM